MSRNSGGTYSRVTPPGPAGYVGGIGNKIYASQVNGEYNDISAEITDSVSRSGKGAALANLPMGGFKHTGAGSSTANGEYVEHSQIVTLAADILTLIAANEPVGTVKMYYGNTPPAKWLFLNTGANTVPIADYPDLYDLLVTNSGYSPVSCAIQIAAAADVTAAEEHGFTDNELIRLSTTGALPTPLDTSTDYYVKATTLTKFELSLTPGGTSITTSGTQYGIHSYLRTDWGLGDGSTTFGMPWIERGRSPVNTITGLHASTADTASTITGATPATSIRYMIKAIA